MTNAPVAVSARLARGSRQGEWQAYRSTSGDAIAVFVHCPFCGALAALGDIPVASTGHVQGALECSYCRVVYRLFLEAWAFADADRPAPYVGSAISQADGFGA